MQVKSGSSIRSWVAKRDAMKKNQDDRGSVSTTTYIVFCLFPPCSALYDTAN